MMITTVFCDENDEDEGSDDGYYEISTKVISNSVTFIIVKNNIRTNLEKIRSLAFLKHDCTKTHAPDNELLPLFKQGKGSVPSTSSTEATAITASFDTPNMSRRRELTLLKELSVLVSTS